MNTHPETEWDIEDEAWLQEAMENRRIEREERNSRKDFHFARNGRNGERIQLTCPHPFAYDDWVIFGPASDPGFYFCHCTSRYAPGSPFNTRNGFVYRDTFEQVFHESDFITIMP